MHKHNDVSFKFEFISPTPDVWEYFISIVKNHRIHNLLLQQNNISFLSNSQTMDSFVKEISLQFPNAAFKASFQIPHAHREGFYRYDQRTGLSRVDANGFFMLEKMEAFDLGLPFPALTERFFDGIYSI